MPKLPIILDKVSSALKVGMIILAVLLVIMFGIMLWFGHLLTAFT